MEHVRYRKSGIMNRQIDTLIGLCHGILADGKVEQAEVEYLHGWLIGNAEGVADNPLFEGLFATIETVLQDGVLDAEEAIEIRNLLESITGAPGELGEVLKAADFPINQPAPRVEFPGRTFLLTGTFAFGSRGQCSDAVMERGGTVAKNVSKRLDYLVIGTYASPAWKHETFGRKIEAVVDYRARGLPVAIVTEEHWRAEGQIALPGEE